MRQFCLQQLAHSGFRVVEVNAREEALSADEVVICNALMPVVPSVRMANSAGLRASCFSF
jgi:4-amino-4-deoxychorismate lyase